MSPQCAARVEALLARERRVLLGITGPPGTGKTTLAEAITSAFDDVAHVPMDGFHLADVELRRLGRLERKVTKQRKRLDRLTGRGDHGDKPAKARRIPRAESGALDLITAAEREAAEIRRAARREREVFRAELVGLLSRFAPVDDDLDGEYED